MIRNHSYDTDRGEGEFEIDITGPLPGEAFDAGEIEYDVDDDGDGAIIVQYWRDDPVSKLIEQLEVEHDAYDFDRTGDVVDFEAMPSAIRTGEIESTVKDVLGVENYAIATSEHAATVVYTGKFDE